METIELIKKLDLIKNLANLSKHEIIFDKKVHPTLASAIISSKIPYMPGIYLVFELNRSDIGRLLYFGKSGADKSGNINNHQIPRRLLATINPPNKYRNSADMPKSKDVTRAKAWPVMMKIDCIEAIKIICYFSEIDSSFKIKSETNPIILEQKVNEFLKKHSIKPFWKFNSRI